ncbi:nodulin-related protein 1-like [Phragmites australis]|uniref:nodulin-related protein 1-like n=1 Tax=Phragmites australis TaxID=29695 RepID=UPI002D7839E3|nr:nodulin-related protein 1-like [Phragmites australis]
MAEGNNSGDLFSSGKLVAEAAVSVFQQKSADNVDKKEVAGAAEEILHAASTYGKFEDKPVGQYIEKAEGYLKEFSSGPAAGAGKEKADAPAPPAGDAPKPAEPDEGPKEPAPAAEESKSEGFGIGDVVKGAEELVEKQSGGEESAGAAAGGLFKMAQGFMK